MMAVGGLVSPGSVFDDRLTRLPAPIRAKYFLLADQVETLRNAARAALEGWEVEHRRLVEARGRHAEATALEKRDPDVQAARRAGQYAPGARLQAAEGQLALCEERAQGKVVERDRVAQAAADAGTMLHAITETISTSDPTELQPIRVSRPSGANPATDVRRLRQQLDGLLREEVTLRHAPVPLEEALERQDAWLDEAARRYQPPVLHFTTPAYVPPGFDAFAPFKATEMWAALPAWRDLQRQRLREQYANLPAAVASDERASLAAALTTRRQALERQEEALVLLAGTQGIELARRPDVDPVVALCMVLKD
jgi:hypothetical protein